MATQDTWISSYGVEMPQIIYGTAWKKEKTAGLVEQALTLGFRGVDTACQPKHYDEAGVGSGIAASKIERQSIYLQTKFTPISGQDPERVPYEPRASLAQQVAQSFVRSQENLRTPVVDGLVLHSPLANPTELRDVWTAMETVFDAGGARQLGISNCYDLAMLQHLHDGSRVKPAVVQNRFYAKTGYDRLIRDFCRNHGVIYQSFWTLTANPEILAHDTIKLLMQRHHRTAPQIFFRYLSQNQIIPLTGTTSAVHMRQDLDVSNFELAPDECQAIDALL